MDSLLLRVEIVAFLLLGNKQLILLIMKVSKTKNRLMMMILGK